MAAESGVTNDNARTQRYVLSKHDGKVAFREDYTRYIPDNLVCSPFVCRDPR